MHSGSLLPARVVEENLNIEGDSDLKRVPQLDVLRFGTALLQQFL